MKLLIEIDILSHINTHTYIYKLENRDKKMTKN